MDNIETFPASNDQECGQRQETCLTIRPPFEPSPPPMIPSHGLQSMFDTIDYLIVQDGYQCTSCPEDKRRSYHDMPELRRHMVKHVNGERTTGIKTEIRCNHCNGSFDRVDSLRKHLLEVLNSEYGLQADDDGDDARDTCEIPVNYIVKDGYLTCSVCDAEFGHVTRWNKEKFKKHVGKEHWKTPAYKCQECNRWFTEADTLEKHMKRHVQLLDVAWMGTGPSPSVGIEDVKNSVDTLLDVIPPPEVHIKIEPEDESEQQTEYIVKQELPESKSNSPSSSSETDADEKSVKKRRTSKRQRNIAKKRKVGTPCRKIPCSDGSVILACNLCDEGFLLQDLLDRHMVQRHDDRDRPFACSSCSKTYMSNTHLKEHIRMAHTDDKFPCKECGIQLSTKCSWKRHMKRHTEEGLTCTICNEKFSSHSVLTRHKRRVHEKVAQSYICVDCGNTYDNSAALKDHRLLHTDERRWECDVCGLKFKRNRTLVVHKKIHVIKKTVVTFKCQECGEEFSTKFALATHRSIHGKVCCRLCKRRFENQSDLMQHRRDDHKISKKDPGLNCRTCHTHCVDYSDLLKHRAEAHMTGTPLECKVCKATFASTAALRTHQREHQRVILYNCPNCSETYNSRLLLDIHLKDIHADVKNHVCDLCGNGYPTKKQFVAHLSRHRNPPQKSAHSNMLGHYICDVCGKEFNSRLSLKRHVFNFHTNERKFQCELCEKVLVSAEGLKLHMRAHAEDQQVMCEICGKGFVQPYRLREHMERHAREANEQRCSICNRAFRDTKKLELHLKSHTGETEFCCVPCQRYFATNKHYRLHLKRMHESETACPVCEKIFPTKKKMKSHVRIHDNPEMFECPTCYACIKDKKHVQWHLRMHQEDGVRLPCHFCPLTFSLAKTRKRHEAQIHKEQQAVLLEQESLEGKHTLKSEGDGKEDSVASNVDFVEVPPKDEVVVD